MRVKSQMSQMPQHSSSEWKWMMRGVDVFTLRKNRYGWDFVVNVTFTYNPNALCQNLIDLRRLLALNPCRCNQ